MEFRNIVIGSELYGDNLELPPIEENINYERFSSRLSDTNIKINFDSRTLNYDLREGDDGSSKQAKTQLIELIFTMIATCHECVPS
jgi:hypothetical protein